MRQWPLFLSVAGLVLLRASPSLADLPASSAAIEAESVDIQLDTETTHASGNARLTYQGLELCADDLTYDRATGEVTASGNLRLTQGPRVMSGESLRYNLSSEEGVLRRARAVEQGVTITGEEIRFSPQEAVAREAQFTTCDRSDPHFAFAAERITLTAEEAPTGDAPRRGRLSLSKGRIVYRGRTVLPVPGYTVNVGDVGTGRGNPTPVLGFSGDDGPYVSLGYTLGRPDGPLTGNFRYRYTTSRGIRGHLRAWRAAGPTELTFGYYRRQDPADRPIDTDDLEAGLADVLVNREPEYGVVLPAYRVGRLFTLQGSWLAGAYTEYGSEGIEELIRADRSSIVLLARSDAYRVSPFVRFSHAIGWRQSKYRPGDELAALLLRTTAEMRLGPRLDLELSHVSRRESGESPFLFDAVGPSRELIADLNWTVNPAWRLRLIEEYDLENNETRDMILEVTRTAHCLEYTLGWRSERRALYAGFGLALPSAQEYAE
jgi:lipopolysaccharide export system protein LptA